MLYILVLYISGYLNISQKKTILISAFACFAVTLIIHLIIKRKVFPIVCVFISVILSLGISVSYFDFKVKNITSLADKELFVEGEVLKEKSVLSFQNTYEVKIKKQKGMFSSFRGELTVPSDITLDEGDVFSGVLSFRNFADDIDGYPEKRYKQSKNILLACESDDITVIGKSDSPYCFFRKINRYLSSLISKKLRDDVSPFVRCVLLGDRDDISAKIKRDFENLGISHMLAISGMHFSIITGFLYLFLSALCVDKRIKNIIMILFCILIMAVTGFSVSVVRAGVMLIISFLCFYFGKISDPASALCFACALICFVSPCSVYDAGLILSFCATFVIVTVGEKIRADVFESKLPQKLKKPITALLVSLAASFALLPASYFYFGKISFASPVFTVLFSPVLALILYLALILLLTSKIPFVSFIIVKLLDATVGGALNAVSFISDSHIFTISLDYPFVVYLILIFVLICLLLFVFCPKKSVCYFLPIVFFALAYPTCKIVYNDMTKDEMYVSVCNTGVNDMISCTQEGKSTLIDSGNGSFSPIYSAYTKTMKNDCVTSFSSYIVINYYNKSTSSLNRLLSREFVKTVYLPEPSEDDCEIYERMCETAEDAGVNAITYKYGEALDLSPVSVIIDEPVYIKRSKRPINKIHIKSGDDEVIYLGAAYSETADLPDKATLICGTYGPKYKENFSCENEDIYLCESASDFYVGNSLKEYDDYLRIIIKNDD